LKNSITRFFVDMIRVFIVIASISDLKLDLKTQYVVVYLKKKSVELNRLSKFFNELTRLSNDSCGRPKNDSCLLLKAEDLKYH
jgi:hypothetical protein